MSFGWLDGGQVRCDVIGAIDDHTVEVKIQSCGTSATVQGHCKWIEKLVVGCEVVIRNFSILWDDKPRFDISGDRCKTFILPSPNRGKINNFELFAGISGWGQAMMACDAKIAVHVEGDVTTANACGQTHGIDVLEVGEALKLALDDLLPESFVLHGRVEDEDVWQILCLYNCMWGFASPPCQPWSESGVQGGLNDQDGSVFLKMLEFAGLFRIQALLVENVKGFTKHPDYKNLIEGGRDAGMVLALGGIYPCHKICPIQRDRWLGTFISSIIQLGDVSAAQALSLSDRAFVRETLLPSIKTFDASHVNITEDETEDLMPTLEAKNLLSTWSFLPDVLKKQVDDNHEKVLNARVIHESGQIPCAMAMYGSQHKLPLGLLRMKGLHTYLFCDCNGKVRYFSPWEFLACMGHTSKVCLPKDLQCAFRIAGNAISTWHAFLQIAKTAFLKLSLQNFPIMNTVDAAFKRLMDQRLHLSMYQRVENDGYFQMQSIACVSSPVHKRARCDTIISPTIQFQADPSVDEFLSTGHMKHHAKFLQDDCKASSFCKGGVMILKHSKGHWMMTSHGHARECVSDMITRALPHAKEGHFESFVLNEKNVDWNSVVVCCPPAFLYFTPNDFHAEFLCPEISECIKFKIDTTWTAKAAVSYIAAKLKVLPESIVAYFQGLPIKEDDFLLEFGGSNFTFGFKACRPAYVNDIPKSEIQHDLRPAHSGIVRISAKHPTSKAIRTIVVSKNESFGNVARELFPDLSGSTAWTLFKNGANFDIDEKMHCLDKNPEDKIEIQWNCLRPLEATMLHFHWKQHPIDTPGFLKGFGEVESKQRWIKTPFHAKASILRIPVNITMMQLAAAIVAHTQVKTNMLCCVNGNPVDPNCGIEEISEQHVICFRFCPLAGGGKKNVVDSLTDLLSSKGVPKEFAAPRAKELVNKATYEAFQNIDFTNENDAWSEIKKIANQNAFRLVTSHELRDKQKAMRHSKPPSNASGMQHGKKARKEQRVFDLANITIQPGHFWDEDRNVNVLEPSRFGPDQAGITSVPTNEVDGLLRCKPKSVDGLAILAVGRDAWKYGETFSVPAHTKAGEPLVVNAALIQCGDRSIVFRANIPNMKLDAIPATVLEFMILKKFVANWKETSIPLRYLGIHLPPIRGSNIIGAWSIRTYDDNRIAVGHEHATSWHGYIKIADELLHNVLSRSGHAGIFTTPRSEDKRPDPRFGIVPIPNCSLEDALQHSSGAGCLGVCIAGQHFAVRCLREKVVDIRQKLAPEMAFVQTAEFDHDDILFTVRNIATHIGADSLSKALGDAGWPCKAVRPAGQSAWVVAAKKAPNFSHLCINGGLAFVEPMRKQHSMPLTVTAQEFHVSTSMDTNGQFSMSTTTRIAEVKQEMSNQIQLLVDQRMAAANERIDSLTLELRESQLEARQAREAVGFQMQQLQQEQQFVSNRVSDVEASVQSCSQSIISQMQSMLQSVQTNIQASVSHELKSVHNLMKDIEKGSKESEKRKAPDDNDDDM